MDQAFDAWLQLDERAVVGDVGHAAGETDIPDTWLLQLPDRFQLFHAEADTLGLAVEADNLYVDGLSDLQGFRRVINAAPRDIRDVQQTVRHTEVDGEVP